MSKLTPFTSMKGEDLLAARAICLCDDDNDIVAVSNTKKVKKIRKI